MTEKNTKNCSDMPRILAVDFDGTIVTDEFPNIGKPNVGIIEQLKQLKSSGVKLILWTCRTNNNSGECYLDNAVNWCEKQGLIFDAVNDNIQEIKDFYGQNPRKIFADLYLDDRSVDIGFFNLFGGSVLPVNEMEE
nr:MAG TPA: acid phosphatase [Caudoviricetes sp.]